MKVLLFILLIFHSVWAMAFIPPRPKDWKSYLIKEYQIELIELPMKRKSQAVMLMIPGFTQNATSLDLLPEKNISIARYLSDTLNLQVYLLNVRGLGKSARGHHMNMDDFCIEDIPSAIKALSRRVGQKIFVFGHSQGSIMVQASMAGLSHCQKKNCFRSQVAEINQSFVRGLALSAGNVNMSVDNPENKLVLMGKLGHFLRGPLGLLDYMHFAPLIKHKVFLPFAHAEFWEFLYHKENVSSEAEEALYLRSVEATWSRVLLQFAEAARTGKMKALGGDFYDSGLSNIKVPVAQVTYGLDPMAEPVATYRDSFSKIGSVQKKFYVHEGQGHEDYMMNPLFHSDWLEPMKWLTKNSGL